jgi:uncharacterized oxidoreductase
MQTQGNTVLITGGDRGIGLALAEAFAKDNKVIICGRDEKALSAAQLAVSQIDTTQCDLTIRSEREELVKWATLNHPELNVLVNNAGVTHRVDVKHDSFDFDVIERELVTDLHVAIELTLRLLSHFRQKPRAALINVTTGLVYGTGGSGLNDVQGRPQADPACLQVSPPAKSSNTRLVSIPVGRTVASFSLRSSPTPANCSM